VPREVGEIVVYYLWLIEPFVRMLQTAIDREFVPGSWMWEPAPEDEWEEEGEEEDVEEDEEGAGHPDGGHRHHPDAGAEGRSVDKDDAIDGDPDDIQYVRQTVVPPPPSRNCDGFWDSDRVRRVLRRETTRQVGVAIGTAD
jgi:hypothetical protein